MPNTPVGMGPRAVRAAFFLAGVTARNEAIVLIKSHFWIGKSVARLKA